MVGLRPRKGMVSFYFARIRTDQQKKDLQLICRKSLIFNGAPRKIRTPGLLIRSQTLYPAELAAHKDELYRLISGICQSLSVYHNWTGGEGGIRTLGSVTLHSLSRRAPSASRSPLRNQQLFNFKMADGQGFEPRVSFPTIVFKTTALSRSASHP